MMLLMEILVHTTIGCREFPYPFDHGRKPADRGLVLQWETIQEDPLLYVFLPCLNSIFIFGMQ